MTETAPSDRDTAPVEFWVGAYTADAGGHGAGIHSIVRDPVRGYRDGGPAAVASSPSFLATHPKLPVVYAVHEFARTVSAFARDGRTALVPIGEPWPTGDAGCHVSVDPEGRFLVVTCWGDGSVLLFELDAFGRITDRAAAPPARDPYGRSEGGAGAGAGAAVGADVGADAGVGVGAGVGAGAGAATAAGSHAAGETATEPGRPSRAHASLMLGGDRLMTTDLGFDLIRVWTYLPGRGLAEDHEVALPEGSGPRHLALHASGRVYVDTEYSVEVAVLEPSGARYRLAGVGPATLGGTRAGDAGSEIALSADGRFAYVGVRGSNRIGTLAIDADGATRPVADSSAGGDWPRHLAVADGVLLVADERSGNVAVLPIDGASGVPGPAVQSLDIPSPTAVIPA